MSSPRKAAAADLRLTDTTVIGGNLVAVSPKGTLYIWVAEKSCWAPLCVSRPFAEAA